MEFKFKIFWITIVDKNKGFLSLSENVRTEMPVLIMVPEIDLTPELIHGVYSILWLIEIFCSVNNIKLEMVLEIKINSLTCERDEKICCEQSMAKNNWFM